MKVLKMTGKVFAIVLSSAMILWYFISGIINIGSIVGILFFGCTGTAAVFSKKLGEFAEKCKKRRLTKVFFELLCILVAIIMLYFAVVVTLMLYTANRAPQEENATVVVLGCQVRGTTPSRMLYERINAARLYLIEHPDAKCIVSGGQGDNEDISEAECMYRELVKFGIDESRIYLEDQSSNTRENIEFSEKIIKENKLNKNMAIVTDGFHQLRAAVICKKTGYSCGAVSSNTPFYLLANFSTREILAFTKELISR